MIAPKVFHKPSKQISNIVRINYGDKIVECGGVEEIFNNGYTDYKRLLTHLNLDDCIILPHVHTINNKPLYLGDIVKFNKINDQKSDNNKDFIGTLVFCDVDLAYYIREYIDNNKKLKSIPFIDHSINCIKIIEIIGNSYLN